MTESLRHQLLVHRLVESGWRTASFEMVVRDRLELEPWRSAMCEEDWEYLDPVLRLSPDAFRLVVRRLDPFCQPQLVLSLVEAVHTNLASPRKRATYAEAYDYFLTAHQNVFLEFLMTYDGLTLRPFWENSDEFMRDWLGDLGELAA